MEEEAESLLKAIRAGDPSLEKVLFAEDIVKKIDVISAHMISQK